MSFGEEFLTMPDLFPARKSGEVWGPLALVLDLPGGPYRVDGLAETQVSALEGRFAGTTTSPSGDEPATLQVFRAAESDFVAVDTRNWEYRFDAHHSPHAVRVAGLDLMARVDESPQPGAALWTPLSGGRAFLQAFENVLRLYLAYRVFSSGGLVLHCSAAVGADQAYLFVCRSGAGKSTAARLSLETGHEVLSDDLNALLPRHTTFLVQALPFTGDLEPTRARRGAFPVARLCGLKQAPAHAVGPLSDARLSALLAACSPFLNADPTRSEQLLGRTIEIARAVPSCELRFRADAGFWDLLLAGASDRVTGSTPTTE